MDANQASRISRAREVLNEERRKGPRSTAEVLGDLSDRVGKLDYWLRDIIALAEQLDSTRPSPAADATAGPPAAVLAAFRDARRGMASCGHPADEDGECSCSSWPERAPMPERPARPAPIPGRMGTGTVNDDDEESL